MFAKNQKRKNLWKTKNASSKSKLAYNQKKKILIKNLQLNSKAERNSQNVDKPKWKKKMIWNINAFHRIWALPGWFPHSNMSNWFPIVEYTNLSLIWTVMIGDVLLILCSRTAHRITCHSKWTFSKLKPKPKKKPLIPNDIEKQLVGLPLCNYSIIAIHCQER